ncbi:MAG: hypothetical protein ABIB71_02380 [Candidatus Woesearchaeota archaeon]
MIKYANRSMDGLLSRYEETLGHAGMQNSMIECLNVILNPDQINDFLQSTVVDAGIKSYAWITGQFISKLIQNSYDAGNNGFSIDTHATGPLDILGEKLSGRPDERIKLQVEGNVGDLFGSMAKHLCSTVNGNTGNFCASYVKDSEIEVNGRFGHGLGLCSNMSVFKTQRKENLGLLGKDISKYQGNKAYFVHGDGVEELVWLR